MAGGDLGSLCPCMDQQSRAYVKVLDVNANLGWTCDPPYRRRHELILVALSCLIIVAEQYAQEARRF